jgi:lipid A 3-O-deacylase
MRLIYFFQFLLVIGFPRFIFSQAIDNTAACRNIASDRYFRIFYENDFFSGTDRDYTQGIYIEKLNPYFKKFFLTKLLWHPKFSDIKFGIAIEHDAYTPNFIAPPEIQYGDRPYAAALVLKTYLVTTDFVKAERICTSISTGIIGPAAGGEQMQRTIHHWITK